MATIPEIRAGIEARLETLAAVRVAQEWGDQINVSGTASAAIVEYAGTVYDTSMQGQSNDLTFTVTALASKVSDRAGRAKLDALCDPTPTSATALRSAVNGTLGGVVAYAVVTANTGYREFEVGTGVDAAAYLGVEFTVLVAP